MGNPVGNGKRRISEMAKLLDIPFRSFVGAYITYHRPLAVDVACQVSLLGAGEMAADWLEQLSSSVALPTGAVRPETRK